MIFIDKLHLAQDFKPGSLPILGDEEHLIVEKDSGHVKTKWGNGTWAEGSYSTKLRITSDGTTLRMSGNPSRFGREDNLFGFTELRDCIAVYNEVLADLGLPRFNISSTNIMPLAPDSWLTTSSHETGVRITQLDLTTNFKVGKQNVLPFIRSIASNTIRGQAGFTYANGLTTDWFRGSKRLYLKYYAKAQHYKKLLKHPTKYQLKLADWMEEQGIIRFEISLKQQKLKDLDLEHVRAWSQETMREIVTSYYCHNQFKSNPFGDVAEQIKALKPEATHNECERAEQIVAAWMTGYDCRKLPKTTYYRYRSLIKLVGVDIGTPCKQENITTLIRTIDIEPLTVPDFYKHVA